MEALAVRRFTMLVRVREFATAHPDLFPADALGGRTFAELARIVDRLRASVISESSGRSAARQETLSKSAARKTLRDGMATIARTARGIAVDTPGLAGVFLVPDGKNDHELAVTARYFAGRAAPLAAAFIAHGLPASFVADLQAALASFERATSARTTATQAHISARAGITAGIAAAFAILPRLDAIVENRVATDPALLAVWRLARHVQGRSVKAKTSGFQRARVPVTVNETVTPNVLSQHAGLPKDDGVVRADDPHRPLRRRSRQRAARVAPSPSPDAAALVPHRARLSAPGPC